MRTIDVFYAFPSVLLAIALSGALGAGITNSLISLTIVFIPPIARVAESVTTQLRNREFIDAARASGAHGFTIVRVHVLGNVLSPIFVYATSLIAVIFAAPIGILGAVYLVEFAPRRLAAPLAFLVELIAAIPSVVFGLWAVGDLSNRLRDSIEWWIASSFGQIFPWLSEDPTAPASDSVFRAGFLLAIMILPMIVAVSREFLRSVPISLREGYIGMGATRWEAIRDVVIPTARVGLIGAVLLALGRALGETIAVTMVIGNAEGIPSSLFLPGQTIASKIANNIGETSGAIPLASMVALALSLFLLSFFISLAVRLKLRRFSQVRIVS
jgi:phosphate transport system permease protein